MLSNILSVIHIIACLFLILVVLLQQGKMGGLGGMGGATTQQVFGGRGAGNLLTRLTAVFATMFMVTSITLAYLASAGDIKLRKSTDTTGKVTPLPPPPAASSNLPPPWPSKSPS